MAVCLPPKWVGLRRHTLFYDLTCTLTRVCGLPLDELEITPLPLKWDGERAAKAAQNRWLQRFWSHVRRVTL